MKFAKGHKINLGKKHSKETKRKMSLKKIGNKINLGKRHSDETKEKIRQKKIGVKLTEKQKRKIGLSNLRKHSLHNLGKIHSEETKKKIGKSNKGKHIWTYKMKKDLSLKMQGKNGSNWQGGLTKRKYSFDWTETLKRSIRERDKYICQLCFKKGKAVHHIDYNKENCIPQNLVNLCFGCNVKVNKNRIHWKYYFKKLMKERAKL